MALSAAAAITTHGPDSRSFLVTNGVTIYKGALVGIVVGTGTLTNHDDAAASLPIGYALETVVGDGTLRIQVQLRGDIVANQTITGVSGAAQNGRSVYATDENTFTLARPADDAAVVGIVLEGGASDADLFLFSAKESAVLALAGGNKRTINLGRIHTTALEGTSGINLRTSFPLWGHGTIVDFYAYPDGYDSGYSGGAQTLNLEIGGTNVTGGSLGLSDGAIDAVGDLDDKISATAITAANEFNDGDLLDIEMASGGTGFTAGVDTVGFNLFIDVEYRAGA